MHRSMARAAIVALLAAAACAALAPASSAATPNSGTPAGAPAARPLSSLLGADGTIDNRDGYAGAVDVSGYTIVAGSGEPRFLPAAAGDDAWDDRFGRIGTAYSVTAVAVAGADVYVGGSFTAASGLASGSFNHIAHWNGRGWTPLGTGTDSDVNAIAIVGTTVYAGGLFTTAGGVPASHIARWDGTTWSALGSGLTANVGETVNVFAITPYQTNLVIGGYFRTAGGVAASSIAQYNPATTAWSALGTGVITCTGCSFPPPGTVRALVASGATLYAAGTFDKAGTVTSFGIASWNGSTWAGFGAGATLANASATVNAIALEGADLYIGGNFNKIDTVLANSVARLSGGAWQALGNGIQRYGYQGVVNALGFTGGRLYAGGSMDIAGTVAAAHLAQWDGVAWSTVGTNQADQDVITMAVDATSAYVGGRLTVVDGLAVNFVARWNGSAWNGFGGGLMSSTSGGIGQVVAAAPNGHVFGGGIFTQAGSAPAKAIAEWNGTGWQAMGSGLAYFSGNGTPFAIAVNGTDVFVGGQFDHAGGVVASNIAKWDGTTWSALGTGVNGIVRSLGVFGGYLYAGGSFTTAGPTPASKVARYNLASNTWSTLGAGLSINGTVYSLAYWQNRYVVVGGSFTSVGNPAVAVNSLLMWDDQTITAGQYDGWYLPGDGVFRSGLAGEVDALAIDGDRLYVGGGFDRVGNNAGSTVVNTISIAELSFTTNQWGGMAGGVAGGAAAVYALAVDGGKLFAGGDFTSAGATAASSVASWDPTAGVFSALGSGVQLTSQAWQPRVRGMAGAAGSIYLTGEFNAAGAKPSGAFGHYTSAAPLPSMTVTDKSVTEGATGTKVSASFTIKLSAPSTTAVTVTAATQNGTALSGSDYIALTKLVTIPAGATSVKVKVTVNGDNTVEPTETFTVKLSAAQGATITDSSGLGKIKNDD